MPAGGLMVFSPCLVGKLWSLATCLPLCRLLHMHGHVSFYLQTEHAFQLNGHTTERTDHQLTQFMVDVLLFFIFHLAILTLNWLRMLSCPWDIECFQNYTAHDVPMASYFNWWYTLLKQNKTLDNIGHHGESMKSCLLAFCSLFVVNVSTSVASISRTEHGEMSKKLYHYAKNMSLFNMLNINLFLDYSFNENMNNHAITLLKLTVQVDLLQSRTWKHSTENTSSKLGVIWVRIFMWLERPILGVFTSYLLIYFDELTHCMCKLGSVSKIYRTWLYIHVNCLSLLYAFLEFSIQSCVTKQHKQKKKVRNIHPKRRGRKRERKKFSFRVELPATYIWP